MGLGLREKSGWDLGWLCMRSSGNGGCGGNLGRRRHRRLGRLEGRERAQSWGQSPQLSSSPWQHKEPLGQSAISLQMGCAHSALHGGSRRTLVH